MEHLPVIIYTSRNVSREFSRPLAVNCARSYCEEFHIPTGNFSLSATQKGKPYFPFYPSLDFSISHSGALWVCAVSFGAVGIDIQRQEPLREGRIAQRFFSCEEQEFAEFHGSDGFFQIWAAKEAYTKYLGLGLTHPFSSFSTVNNGSMTAELDGCFFSYFSIEPSYALCLCTSFPSPQIFVRPASAAG